MIEWETRALSYSTLTSLDTLSNMVLYSNKSSYIFYIYWRILYAWSYWIHAGY